MLARLLATPVTEPRRSRSRVRPRALAVAGAACVALAVFVAINLLGSKAPGAVRGRPGGGGRDPRRRVPRRRAHDRPRRRAGPAEIDSESWYTHDGRLHRKAFGHTWRKARRLAEEFAGRRRPGRSSGVCASLGPALEHDDEENGFVNGGGGAVPRPLHGIPARACRRSRSRASCAWAGTTTVDGKRAYRLVSGAAGGQTQTEVEITVDAETYLPLTQRVTLSRERGRSSWP